MDTIEFRAWPKIPRLFRDVTVTEKIDGTNAAIGVVRQEPGYAIWADGLYADVGGVTYRVYAQSRKRVVTPEQDNHGFGRWVSSNVAALVEDLGEGLHFGEWWGSGIQRGYGLKNGEKRFSLFNTTRWAEAEFTTPGLGVVPVIYEGPLTPDIVESIWGSRRCEGDLDDDFKSLAAPGYNRPEGLIVYHHASNSMFKVTIDNDESPKGNNA